ncbi:hypothetical protein [Polaromonas sp. YR568]|uniref:hypothetical protein n=1 Tax=Polaromonas sp. YR568 TaxID=1855301 RepID=UPI00398BCF9A
MTSDLASVLPSLLPAAIAWVERQEVEIIALGAPLTESELSDARSVGVAYPEKVRVMFVDLLPLPDDLQLRQVALNAGLLGPGMIGLTLGYGIYIRNGYNSRQLLTHECRHVYQYEQAGSIASYIPRYLQQVAEVGYAEAPYEKDARAHEIK